MTGTSAPGLQSMQAGSSNSVFTKIRPMSMLTVAAAKAQPSHITDKSAGWQEWKNTFRMALCQAFAGDVTGQGGDCRDDGGCAELRSRQDRLHRRRPARRLCGLQRGGAELPVEDESSRARWSTLLCLMALVPVPSGAAPPRTVAVVGIHQSQLGLDKRGRLRSENTTDQAVPLHVGANAELAALLFNGR